MRKMCSAKKHKGSQKASRRFAVLGLIQNPNDYFALTKTQKRLLSAKAWKRENCDKNLQGMIAWRRKNVEHNTNYWKINGTRIRKDFRARLKEAVFARLGNECACPGCESKHIKEFFCVDHITPIKYNKRYFANQSFSKFYREVLNHPDPRSMYRILCFNCNAATRYYKSCPHNIVEVNAFKEICQKFIS